MQNYHRIYCDDCYPNIALYRSRCAFLFNVVENYGWYSPAGNRGRNKKRNMVGVSRDHMFSIGDGFKMHVSPEIVAHPANCQLLLHDQNIKKHSLSCITLEELIVRISEWNERYGGQ